MFKKLSLAQTIGAGYLAAVVFIVLGASYFAFELRLDALHSEALGLTYAQTAFLRHAALKAVIFGALAALGTTIMGLAVIRNITNVLRQLVSSMGCSAAEVAQASSGLAQNSQEIAQGSMHQAASVEETSASLSAIETSTRENVATTEKAGEVANLMGGQMKACKTAMNHMSEAIREVKQSSLDSSRIIQTIDEIAFQTNLLALNAAVEAARAGEAGKGFAVVANEVRNLAKRSAGAVRSTSELIDRVRDHADLSVTVCGEVNAILDQIVDETREVGDLMEQIQQASRSQSSSITEINTAVTVIDDVTRESAGNAQQSAAVSEEFAAQAEELNSLVGTLKAILASGRG